MSLPTVLYRCHDVEGDLLYVGVSMAPGQRISSHEREQGWWGLVATITVEEHATRDAALAAEAEAIRRQRPRYNVQHIGEGRRAWRRARDTRPALPPTLRSELQSASEKRQQWNAEHERLILEALDAGGSLREIAEVAQVSHQTVKNIRDRHRSG
jgi:DNA-binding NarL/FixJ family response regulator